MRSLWDFSSRVGTLWVGREAINTPTAEYISIHGWVARCVHLTGFLCKWKLHEIVCESARRQTQANHWLTPVISAYRQKSNECFERVMRMGVGEVHCSIFFSILYMMWPNVSPNVECFFFFFGGVDSKQPNSKSVSRWTQMASSWFLFPSCAALWLKCSRSMRQIDYMLTWKFCSLVHLVT